MSTETLRDTANIVLIIGLVLAACGTFGVNYFRARLELERDATARTKDSSRASQMEGLQGGMTEVLQSNQALRQQLAPFEALAKQRYPGAPPPEALTRLQEEMSAVKAKAAQLEQKVLPRRLSRSATASANVKLALSPFAGTEVDIVALLGDDESFHFAHEIEGLPVEAGLHSLGISQSVFSGPVQGLHVRVRDHTLESAGSAVITALHLVGVSPVAELNPTLPERHIQVVVGAR